MSISKLRAVLAALLVSFVAAAPAGAHVLPPGGHPYGQTYGQWQADWWRWALTQPADANPLFDATGQFCANGQRGPVWFLAGTLDGTPVTRSCRVPAGRALLFPVVNLGYFAFQSDPPEQRTLAYVRAQTQPARDATGLFATVDGFSVPAIKARYYTESVFFAVRLGPNNLLGLEPGSLLAPAADAGYYLIVPPLSRGVHTIHFGGTGGSVVDVTYQLRVDR